MGCPACGAENLVAAKFCEECGARQPRRCPSCGHDVGATAKFCLECGERLGEAFQPSRAPAMPTSPQSYVPRHLAEKILAERDGLAGERKQITVLFADLVGSTELIQGFDPEDAQRLLDGAVQCMMDAVHHYEGTVSRLQGDGLMALFGAPIAHEDHALRACYAALAMQNALRRYADEVHRSHGAVVESRVGINSGEVVIRLISDDLHMDYTALGQTVHLAARMEQLARAGTALLAPSTMTLVDGLIEARPLGPLPIKGLAEPVNVYQLVSAGSARTRLQAAAARGLTPLVGREHELTSIQRALARVLAGQGQVVALVAEPGVGKSRLIWEVTRAQLASTPGPAPTAVAFTTLEAHAVSFGQTTSWLPIVELLRAYCRVESRDAHQTIQDKVARTVLSLDPTLAPNVTALVSLLDVPVDDAAWAALDAPRRRRQTLEAVKQLVLRTSRDRPLLLVFEDLHWVDAETQALLDELVESLPATRTLLLVSYRPEYQHGWGSKSYYSQLRIDPLAAKDIDELLDVLLGGPSTGSGAAPSEARGQAALEPLKALLRERTEGNPLFLEESVRSLVESGVLVGARGSYHLAGALRNVQVPATVQAVLAARIDRLPPEERRLLQSAAVIGKSFALALLQGIVDGPRLELQSGLARLSEAELVYPASLFPEPEYTFKHALTHEVAYAGLLQDRRRTLHARIVTAIEQLYPDRLDEHVERLAYHALHGDLLERALTYARQAGTKDMARSAYREAAAWQERAIDVLARLPESPERLEQALDLRLGMRTALAPLGETGKILGHLREAELLAERLGDRRRLAWVWSSTANACWVLGRYDETVRVGQRAVDIASELDEVPLLVSTSAISDWGHQIQIRECGDFRGRRGIHDSKETPEGVALPGRRRSWR